MKFGQKPALKLFPVNYNKDFSLLQTVVLPVLKARLFYASAIPSICLSTNPTFLM